MLQVSEAALLEVWDRGAAQALPARALALLALTEPGVTVEALAMWPLGRRDRAILELRERLWGDQVHALAACPDCGRQAELDFRTHDIYAPFASAGPIAIEAAGVSLRLRPLTTRDLLAPVTNHAQLIAQCLVGRDAATEGALAVAVDGLTEAELDACARALAEADPQADIELRLTCADCGAMWDAPFDTAAFVWRELDDWARRTLREIARLAAAFGWTEDAVLRLSSRRRQHYLALVSE